MSESETFKPLLSVGVQYIRETMPKITFDQIEELEKTLDEFIEEKINFDTASTIFQKILTTTRPLEKIQSVLQIDDNPIVPGGDPSFSSFPPLFNYQNSSRKKTHPWSEYEDQRLLSGIHKFGLDNWVSVSNHVGNGRTRAQCSQRWFRGLDPRISKVLWTTEEEQKLVELVDRHGDRCWTKIASELGNRSDAQCRYHFRQMMKDHEDDSASKSIESRDRPRISMVSSAPNSQFKTKIPSILPSQSQFVVETSNNKIPPINSFLENIDNLPIHMRLSFPPVVLLPSIDEKSQDENFS